MTAHREGSRGATLGTLSYDAIVEGLIRVGVPRAAAEVRARREIVNAEPSEPDTAALRRENVLEKVEQNEIRKLFVAFGCKVYWLSQARRTGQTKALPDLWAVHRTQPIAFWWETKRQVGGKHTDEQIEFGEECQRTNTPYGTGDRYDAATWLRDHGLAAPGSQYPPEPISLLSRTEE